jgi:C-terminal peptidase prc
MPDASTAQPKGSDFMTKAMWKGLLGLLVLAAAVAPAARAAEPRPARQFVVLVGISEYNDKQINPRPNAENDAKALYDLFTDKQYLGVDADHIRLLLGKEDAKRKSQPATKDNIIKSLEWLRDEATAADDEVIFAFFGEGGTVGERGDRRCYFAVDSSIKDRVKDAVAASQVGEILDKLKAQHFLALLDVSFRGFTTKESVPEATADSLGTPIYKEFRGDDGSEEHLPLPSRSVFLATNGLFTALDVGDHGVFAKVVLEALKGKADTDGYEPDGLVVVDELSSYLDKNLPDLVRENGKTKEEKERIHLTIQGIGSHFPLTHNPEVADRVKAQLDKFNALAKDKKLPAELVEEGNNFLARMPKLEAQRELRKSYQELIKGAIDVDKFKENREAVIEAHRLKRTDALKFAEVIVKASADVRDHYVKEVNQGELIGYAVRGLYRQLDEKVPDEINDQLGKVKDLKEGDLVQLVAKMREGLGKREDLDNHKDIDFTLQRMLLHLDPYTTYIDPETLKKPDGDPVSGSFTGIGIQIRKDANRDMLQVISPIKGSPAYKKGLYAGDIITTITLFVDGDRKPLPKPEVISTKGLSLNEAVKKILGPEGTKVKLTVEREGEKDPLEFEITRGRVTVESVLGYKRKDADWDYYVDPENKIAYVRLTQFARNTAGDLEKLMADLKKTGIKGFVLDLRFNPGGLLTSAIQISDMFVDDGVIVSVTERGKKEQFYYGQSEGSYLGFPMVCLVNGNSASGAEIVAACLQDHGRAKIVGERSYGKGSVQNITPFDGGELKQTIALYWRPSHKNINKRTTKGTDEEDWGVRPDKDFQVDLTRKEEDDLFEHQRNSEIIQRPDKPAPDPKEKFKDVQLEKALEYLRGQIKTAQQPKDKKEG